MFNRRSFLLGSGVAVAATAFPSIMFAAAPTNRRFVFIIQRGAADGLHILAPTGDPDYAGIRGRLAPSLQGGTKIGDFFTLHPALKRIAAMNGQKQARFIHAVSSVYRDRSHFDGQNVLETGGRQPYTEKTGWMNRLIAAVPSSENKAMAIAPAIPAALRGDAPVASYAPTLLPDASADLTARVARMYAGDAQLEGLWKSAMATEKLAGDNESGSDAAAIGALAAKLMVPADGARIMMIESAGWDTHSSQLGRMTGQLGRLDALVAGLADGLGPVWKDTLVVVATEFGRTVALNGTGGTDHGTASAMMLLGGAVTGTGKVEADWPGLKTAALQDGRDLRPTAATEAIIAGALAQHYGIDPAKLVRALYPMQPDLKPRMV
jgi:uncharacterized protein (DUF1501 family)